LPCARFALAVRGLATLGLAMVDRDRFQGLGPNVGLVEELYRQYLEDPESVGEVWREYFADYTPLGTSPAGERAPAAARPPAPAERPEEAEAPGAAQPLRGGAVRQVENMEESLRVPTATSVRTVPAKLLEINRNILNNQLARTGRGKVSFTHLIGFAVVRALAKVPAMNASFALVRGRPGVVRHPHVNLGLAVDLERRDGTRSLLVPNVKRADELDFAGFVAAYEEAIRRVRAGEAGPKDFEGTTATLTNPGMIGTVHSVPRLMPGQGVIVGVGAIVNPPGYEAADPETLARLGVGKVLTLTSTYDHRIIQGAESGEFLGWVHRFLLGEEGFYDDAFASLAVPYEPARWTRDVSPAEESLAAHEKSIAVHTLINLYRVRGHLIANLDPLALAGPRRHPELDPVHHGLTIWDLDREFPCAGIGGRRSLRLRDILRILRDAYSRTVGLEYMHIQEPEQKAWIQERVEREQSAFAPERKRRILERLNAAEAFETFLHTKFVGHKRFGLEGAESLIPMLDALLDRAADEGAEDAVVGMAHRGRLNVLANVIGKSHRQIFREFHGELDPDAPQGSGDVKYHLGAEGTHKAPSGRSLRVTLACNPSHLEAVDPVVVGMARAKQDRLADADHRRVLPVLIHGDAAFAGQGVVGETLNLSDLPGYEVGGTVHLVVNNQVGFTTPPEHARSSVYPTDVAKMVQAPIFHVNGDDPEACVRVVELAFEFRQTFHKDVVVDLVCYRRYGHNEADEPGFTQPRMYGRIAQQRSVRKLYTETLVNRGDIGVEEAEQILADFRRRLDAAFAETGESEEPPATVGRFGERAPRRPVRTGVPREALERVMAALSRVPPGFALHPKLERQLEARRREFEEGSVDWATAEALAFGSLLLEGTPVRLAGQDSRRGTFSQRHAVLVDQQSEVEWTPLAHLGPDQAPFMSYDSLLSEYAALGFEYGYSLGDPAALVCWEAQFGDFVNGAQIVVDQYIAAAEDKWSLRSSLALLLPHGFEGQGPEHSSARIERFLILCAEDNLRVVYPTTAAQYFHALRRQIHAPVRAPLVCFTPKKYLRSPASHSPADDLVSGRFEPVLDDPAPPPGARRVLLCSGKVAHELRAERDARQAAAAIVRLEEIYPFPAAELTAVLARYPGRSELVFVQEEPENMGPWPFVRGEIVDKLRREVRVDARERSASPATGSASVHEVEQRQILDRAFAGLL
jgi:2-oxoglutarate dehydrogenase E1 component